MGKRKLVVIGNGMAAGRLIVHEVVPRRGGSSPLAARERRLPSLEQPHLGDHQLKDGQRLDHLAHFYHDDANGFWRIAAHNGAALPDAVTAAPVEGVTVVRIPRQV